MVWRYVKRTLLVLSLLIVVGVGGSFAVAQSRGGKVLSVQTGSMVPVLNRGDLVSVTRVPKQNLKAGDIVTYINPRNRKQTITHRIVVLPSAANYQKFIVKGDANPAPDAPVDPTAIIGKVNMHVRYAGYAVDFVRKPIGLAILIYVPALLIIIDEIRRLSRHYAEEKPYFSAEILERMKSAKSKFNRWAAVSKLTLLMVVLSFAIALPVRAILKSQASLTGNRISATRPAPPPINCSNSTTTINVSGNGSGTSINNVNVTNSNNQSSSSGNVNVFGNTNVGNISTGNAGNSNNTCTSITVVNH